MAQAGVPMTANALQPEDDARPGWPQAIQNHCGVVANIAQPSICAGGLESHNNAQ